MLELSFSTNEDASAIPFSRSDFVYPGLIQFYLESLSQQHELPDSIIVKPARFGNVALLQAHTTERQKQRNFLPTSTFNHADNVQKE